MQTKTKQKLWQKLLMNKWSSRVEFIAASNRVGDPIKTNFLLTMTDNNCLKILFSPVRREIYKEYWGERCYIINHG